MKVTVVVHPNSKNARIEKDLLGALHVYVSKPPLEGKANKAVFELLAQYFNTKKANIFLISGMKSKNKVFKIVENR